MITLANLPSAETEFFKDSYFFSRGFAALPTPAEVLTEKHDRVGSKRLVLFHSLGVAVKYGFMSIAEGQCLWAIRRYLPDVLVPEVYGWQRDGRLLFLYMELIDGVPLQDRWSFLSEQERGEVCDQMARMMQSLRALAQDPADPFVGKGYCWLFDHAKRI